MAVGALFTGSWTAAQEPVTLALYGGLNDVNESDPDVEFGLELRRPFSGGLFGRLGLSGVLGVTTTDQQALWGYAGVRRDFQATDWVLTPGFAVSYYEAGDGKELGGEIEFRSSIELAYQLRNAQRLGVGFYHLSNAGIYDRNPGLNSVALSWSFLLSR